MRVLLIIGAPGSGKTWLAGVLAGRYRALVCGKDEIKEILFDTLGVSDPRDPPAPDLAWSRRLSDASFALLFAFAQRLLPVGRVLLLEGNFRPGEHERPLAALLPAGGDTQLVQILCHARPASLAARLAARAADPQRHPGHRDGLRAAGAPGALDAPGAARAAEAVVADAAATAAAAAEARPEVSEPSGSDGFLALPGLRLRFDSDAPPEREFEGLFAALDALDLAKTRDASG
ncbi:MAG TPA: AAA family ATPase [Steroidobacteraceae bacterium]|nr:AAA family ATPase [Steroidobacteraceae bacterium]